MEVSDTLQFGNHPKSISFIASRKENAICPVKILILTLSSFTSLSLLDIWQ